MRKAVPGQILYKVCVLAYEMAVEGSPLKAQFAESSGQIGCMPVYVDEARAREDYPGAEIVEVFVPLVRESGEQP